MLPSDDRLEPSPQSSYRLVEFAEAGGSLTRLMTVDRFFWFRSTDRLSSITVLEIERSEMRGDTGMGRRIGLFLPNLHGGGAERMMVHLGQTFAAHGHEVELIIGSADGAQVDTGDLKVTLLGARRVYQSVVTLRRAIERSRPDAILSTLAHANVGTIAATRGMRSRPRVVLREATTISRRGGTLGRTGRMLTRLQKWSYPLADAVVAVSEGVRNELVQYLGLQPESIQVLRNPVVTEAMLAASRQDPAHPWMYDDVPVVIAVGRLIPEKDFETLIRAVALANEHLSLRLVILGEGSERSHLAAVAEQEGIADRVAMPGFVSNPYSWMRRSSLFVLSSRVEGSPNALVEAIACGTRVVATDCECGPREILRDGIIGPLVVVGDPGAMATAILDEIRREGVRGARQEIVASYGADTAARAYEKLLLGIQ